MTDTTKLLQLLKQNAPKVYAIANAHKNYEIEDDNIIHADTLEENWREKKAAEFAESLEEEDGADRFQKFLDEEDNLKSYPKEEGLLPTHSNPVSGSPSNTVSQGSLLKT